MKHPHHRRRLLLLCGLIAGICFLAGALGSSMLPKLRAWVRVKIETVSRDSLPVRILPGSINVDLFPLGVALADVHIAPKPELEDYLHSAHFKAIRLTISPWQLFRG